MREIKFRAWYDSIGYGLSDVFYVGGYPTWNGKTLSMWRGRAIIEQFIGIHDKNNNAAFHNDIYEDEMGVRYVIDSSLGYKVVLINGDVGYNIDSFVKRGVLTGEIIGNIHENPELAEEPHD